MKQVIRKSFFETNSSSLHSLVITIGTDPDNYNMKKEIELEIEPEICDSEYNMKQTVIKNLKENKHLQEAIADTLIDNRWTAKTILSAEVEHMGGGYYTK